MPPSKVLVKIGIEQHGPKAIRTGRGPQVYRRRRQHRRALGSPPSARPARCGTELLGLPRLEASFYGTNQDRDRATRSKSERNRSRSASLSTAPPAPPGAWLSTFSATRSVRYGTFVTTEAWCLLPRYSSRLGSSNTVQRRSGTGRGPRVYRARGLPPSTRLAQCGTLLLGLPRLGASFLGTNQNRDRTTRSKGDE
jgi:hypothetical protein